MPKTDFAEPVKITKIVVSCNMPFYCIGLCVDEKHIDHYRATQVITLSDEEGPLVIAQILAIEADTLWLTKAPLVKPRYPGWFTAGVTITDTTEKELQEWSLKIK
jgi:hypothetical protein